MNDLPSLFLFFLVIAPVGILARIPFFDFPQDEDYGIYSYLAHFRGRGIKFVKDFWGAFFPWVLYIKIGAYKICGGNIKNVRFFFAIYNILTAGAVYVLVSHMFSEGAGLLSALFYCVFSAAPHLGGYSSSAEKYYLFPLTLSVYLLLLGMENKTGGIMALSGIFLGIAFSLKPVVVLNMAAFSLYAAIYDGWRGTAYFLTGCLAAILIHFFLVGIIFRKDIVQYRLQSRMRITLAIAHIGLPIEILERFVTDFLPLFKETFFLWITLIPYFIFSAWGETPHHVLILLWMASTVLILMGQRAFWEYHYIPLIHVLSITSAISVSDLLLPVAGNGHGISIFWTILLGLSLLYSLTNLLPYYLPSKDWKKLLNTFRKMDQYLHMPILGKYIRDHSAEDDYIYVWGPWTNIYLLSDRPSCEKSACHLIRPYNQNHEIQFDEIMKGIIGKKPKFIIQIFSNFNIVCLNNLTGLSYEIDRVIFNRYIVYKLNEKKVVSERLYRENAPWEEKKEKLEILTKGAREHRIYPYYVEHGDTEQYLSEFDKALEANPYDVATLGHLGIFHRNASDYDKSLQYFQRALAVKKDRAWVHFEMAQTYKSMGQEDLMRKELSKAKRYVIPYTAGLLKQLGIIHRLMGNMEKSIRIFLFTLKVSHPTERLFFELGISYKEAGKTKEAIGCFEKEVDLYPDGEWKYYELGLLYLSLECLEEASSCFEMELENYPGKPYVHYLAASALKKKGDLDKAIKHFKKVTGINSSPDSDKAGGHYHIGTILMLRNKTEEAVVEFKNCLQLAPDHKMAAEQLELLGAKA